MTFLVGYLCLIAAGFGVVLAVFERVARQMEQLANHDGLTGCPTRSATDAMQALELLRGRRAGHSVACVLLDLDHFKAVNDRHGHRTVEAMLTPGPDGPAMRVTVSAGLAVADLTRRSRPTGSMARPTRRCTRPSAAVATGLRPTAPARAPRACCPAWALSS